MHKPILIAAQALGPDTPKRDLVVSPQHKILLKSDDNQGLLGPAKGLTSQRGIRRMKGCREVEYFHVLLPAHSIIFADGLATESFYPGETAMKLLTAKQRAATIAAVPTLRNGLDTYGPQIRVSLTRRQAEELPKDQRGIVFGELPAKRKSAYRSIYEEAE